MRPYDRQPIPPLAEDAFEILTDRFDEGEGISWEAVFALLAEEGYAESDAAYAVHGLLNRGYLYEVNNELFVTPPG